MDRSAPPSSFAQLPYYSAHFMDVALWDPFVRWVVDRHSYGCERILPGLPGTFPTFIVELADQVNQPNLASIVVKFFGPLFEGQNSFMVERAIGHVLAPQLKTIPSPAILAEGQLAPDWSYLVFECIPGVSLGQVFHEISPESLLDVAQLLGRFMKELHLLSAIIPPVIPTPADRMRWDEYEAFLKTQGLNCTANHQRWMDLPSHLLEQLPGFVLPVDQLLDLASSPHLVHADLTADHLLGSLSPQPSASELAGVKQWQARAIIDWGDARVGNILYELVALHMDMFHCDKHLLRASLEVYGLPVFYQQDFARKALSMLLLHPFPLPPYACAPPGEVRSLDELADRLFGI